MRRGWQRGSARSDDHILILGYGIMAGRRKEYCLEKNGIHRTKKDDKKYLSIIAAFVMAGVLLLFGYQNVDAEIEDRHWDVVVLGDSIIGKEREEGTIHEYFEEYSGLSMLNAAFGGNCASMGENSYRYSYYEESLSLCRLAEAVCYKDFAVQKADLAASQTKAEYFEEVLAGLAAADPNQTDILLLEFGVNDYTAGRRLDNPEDRFDVYTYGGALRYAIELFREAYPNLEIILVTPAYCHIDGYENCLEEDFGGGTLDQYADMEKEIAAEYGLDVIDVFYEIGFDESNIMKYTRDGMHLRSEGRPVYARFLADKIEELAERKSE